MLNLNAALHARGKRGILTLIKNSFKRNVREELIDFPQDICFVSKRCVAIPDLYNIFPVPNANTDADDLIVWGIETDAYSSKPSLGEALVFILTKGLT